MILVVLYKDLEVLGSIITKREVLVGASIEDLEGGLRLYKTNGWKFQSLYKNAEYDFELEEVIEKLFHT